MPTKSAVSVAVSRLLYTEKLAACDEVARCVRNPDHPRAVSYKGKIIALITVEPVMVRGYDEEDGDIDFVGFVHLTRAGLDLVHLPWSPE